MPSREGIIEHLSESHAAELLARSHVAVPVSASELREHFLGRLSMKDLRILHLTMHRNALKGVE